MHRGWHLQAKIAELAERIATQEEKVAKQPHARLKQKLAEHLIALQQEREQLLQRLQGTDAGLLL